MENTPKSLKIRPKKVTGFKTMWDILLDTEQEDWKYINGNKVCFQTKHMGIRKAKVIVHGVTVDITEDWMGAYFAQYGQVEDASAIISKVDIATGDFVHQVTMTHKSFSTIPQHSDMPRKNVWF